MMRKQSKMLLLSLGSNQGDRMNILKLAINEIEKVLRGKAITSPFYETESWGFSSQTLFLNCCLGIACNLSAENILQLMQEIEIKLGRKHKSINRKYADREIDIDIIYYGKEMVKTPHLIIPHPQLYNRRFVLEPLHEIFPEFKDEIKKLTIKELLKKCPDTLTIKRL